jgi:hypothetical protein
MTARSSWGLWFQDMVDLALSVQCISVGMYFVPDASSCRLSDFQRVNLCFDQECEFILSYHNL